MKIRITTLDGYDETVEIDDVHTIPRLLNSPAVKQIAVDLVEGETFFYARVIEEDA